MPFSIDSLNPFLKIQGDTQKFSYDNLLPNSNLQLSNTFSPTSDSPSNSNLDLLNYASNGYRSSLLTKDNSPIPEYLFSSLKLSPPGINQSMDATPIFTFNEDQNNIFKFYHNAISPDPVEPEHLATKQYVDYNFDQSVLSVGVSSPNNTLAITGSPITKSGIINIDLPDTLVSEGNYSIPINLSVDKQGRVGSIQEGNGIVATKQYADTKIDTVVGTATKLYIAQTASVPIGTIIMWSSGNVPENYLECDGRALSITDYSALFSVLNYTWGGSGTSFRLPDGRGYFPRGFDGTANRDPDKSSRISLYTGGKTGNNVGSYQNDIYGSHNHTDSGHYHSASFTIRTGLAQYATHIPATAAENGTYDTWNTSTNSATANIQYSGGNETRPKNFGIMFCIKYQ